MDLRDIANYGGFVIGLVGIVLSIYLYRRGTEKKEPFCYYQTVKEIEKLTKESSNIKIFYKSNEVDLIYTTYIYFWNRGRKAIYQSDVPPQSPLQLKLVDESYSPNILDYRILKTSRNAINFKMDQIDPHTLSVTFDFLDFNDGAIIEVQHTGSRDTKIEPKGIILGVHNGIKMIRNAYHERPINKYVHRGVWYELGKYFKFLGLVILLGVLGVLLYSFAINQSIIYIFSTTATIHDLLLRELPQISEQSVQNIIDALTVKTRINTTSVAMIIIFYGLMMLLAVISGIKELTNGIPKSLYLDRVGKP